MDRRIMHRATFKERLAEEARRIKERANACASGQTSRDRFEHQGVADIPRPSISRMTIERKPVESDRANWRVGQRVSRTDSQELGIVIEARRTIKVKWDDGRTSYYHPDAPANVKLKVRE
jgi:hypothetical protein